MVSYLSTQLYDSSLPGLIRDCLSKLSAISFFRRLRMIDDFETKALTRETKMIETSNELDSIKAPHTSLRANPKASKGEVLGRRPF